MGIENFVQIFIVNFLNLTLSQFTTSNKLLVMKKKIDDHNRAKY